MNKRNLLVLIFVVVLIYPLISLFQVDQVISEGNVLEAAQDRLVGFQLSIWISWIVLVALAVYHKWTFKRNLIFTLTYGFLFISFLLFGFYAQTLVNNFQLPTSFKDTYTFGVFTAIQNIVVSAILTGFLQAGVWWFTRKR